MAASNPMARTYPFDLVPVSKTTITIAGLLTTIYGLEELQSSVTQVACLWLLHPRGQSQDSMQPIATSLINDWNRKLVASSCTQKTLGLIAVSFDQRNHGSREIDPRANGTWRDGNQTHAQDMLGIYRKNHV